MRNFSLKTIFIQKEFPAVLLNIKSGLIEAEFSHYVKPTKFPVLTEYCKNLTGIAQADVDQALEIKEVLMRFDEWVQRFVGEKNLFFENGDDDVKQNAAICTWTDFDVGVYLKGECKRKSIELKSYFNRRIDASVVFQVGSTVPMFVNRLITYQVQMFQKWKRNYRRCKFTHALQLAGIHYHGRLHSGIDDARNLARLMAKISKTGHVLHVNVSS